MPNPRDVRFTFSSTANIDFDVASFELTEGICELYCLTVNLVSHSATADFAQLLDQPAALTIWQGEQPVRHVHGRLLPLRQQVAPQPPDGRCHHGQERDPDIEKIRVALDERLLLA